MKGIYMIQTFDGELFRTQAEARRYLDVMYSNKMSAIAAKLTSYSDGKYQRTKEWLDENLDQFVEMRRIKTDRDTLPEDEDDEE